MGRRAAAPPPLGARASSLARALLLCASLAAAAAARKDTGAKIELPATPEDLPLLGAGGAPVMTVDGRVCAFPWTGPDGVAHSACALLLTAAGDKRLWCKDAQELWGICAAPKAAAVAPGAAAGAASAAAAPGARPELARAFDAAGLQHACMAARVCCCRRCAMN
jgi:hypothetical protein